MALWPGGRTTRTGPFASAVVARSSTFPEPDDTMMKIPFHSIARGLLLPAALSLVACSGTYYSALEGVGIHKRDLLVDRVEDARDSQQGAQVQFQSALDQFGSVVALEETDLKKAYDQLDAEYRKSADAAEEVSSRIDDVESVADALFDEWDDELDEYDNKELRDASRKQLQDDTKAVRFHAEEHA